MLVADIFNPVAGVSTSQLINLKQTCSQFLSECGEQPLVKALPTWYSNLHRVKLRTKQKLDKVSHSFNEALRDHGVNIHARSLVAYTCNTLVPITPGDTEQYYVFPVNGYKVLYNPQTAASTLSIEQLIERIESNSIDNPFQLITEVINQTYTVGSLGNAMKSKCEVFIYNIPAFYAIKCASVQTYEHILK